MASSLCSPYVFVRCSCIPELPISMHVEGSWHHVKKVYTSTIASLIIFLIIWLKHARNNCKTGIKYKDHYLPIISLCMVDLWALYHAGRYEQCLEPFISIVKGLYRPQRGRGHVTVVLFCVPSKVQTITVTTAVWTALCILGFFFFFLLFLALIWILPA